MDFGSVSDDGSGRTEVQLTLIHGAQTIYCPRPLDRHNLLLAGGRIIGILSDEEASAITQLPMQLREVLDASRCIVTPGFVDLHCHVTGGGGEAGPASRAPQAKLSELLNAGITTVVGVTGTDSVTRCQEALVAKCRGLTEEGITAYHWCGAYRVPVPTITGDVQKEIMVIDGCVGVGEVAVADHRGSDVTPKQLADIAMQAGVGGMLAGKCGLLHLHMGVGTVNIGSGEPWQRLMEAQWYHDAPVQQYLPTHCERSPHSWKETSKWLLRCGNADFTAGPKARQALPVVIDGFVKKWEGWGEGEAVEAEAGKEAEREAEGEEDEDKDVKDVRPPEAEAQAEALSRLTVSSDSYGSFPEYDSRGRMLKYRVVKPAELLKLVRRLHKEGASESSPAADWPLERVLLLVTLNPATRLQLPRKGRIAVGADADLLLFSPDDLQLQYVFAKGVKVRTPSSVRGSMFEEGPGIVPYSPRQDLGE